MANRGEKLLRASRAERQRNMLDARKPLNEMQGQSVQCMLRMVAHIERTLDYYLQRGRHAKKELT